MEDKSGEEKKRFFDQCSTQDSKRAKLTTVEESVGLIFNVLQQMERDARKGTNNTDLLMELKKIASGKGFMILDNQGGGNCMFHALSEQLNLVKGIQISHQDLRHKVVNYLKNNPKLPDGTELFNFVDGHPSWDSYLTNMGVDGTWGDHVILHGVANCFGTCIHVISSQSHHNDVIINPERDVNDSDRLVLGHLHELHYVSLIPRTLSATEENKEISSLDHANSPPHLNIKLPKRSDLPNTSKPWDNADLPVDILLLTAEDCEFLSCFLYLGEPFKCYCRDIGFVYFGSMGNGDQTKLKIALIQCSKGAAVPGGSLTTVKNAVRILHPKAAFAVGTCIGLNSLKTKLGDVVVSSKLTTPVYKTPVSRDIGNLIRHAADGWKAPLENPDAREVRVHCDGNVLSHPEATSYGWQNEQITQKYPNAIAVETEGEGVFAAAHDDKVEWVLVKGVASCADYSQDSTDEWKSFASTNAASVVANILSDPIIFQDWPHCTQDTLCRQLEQKIAKTDDKVEQLEQEVKIQRENDIKADTMCRQLEQKIAKTDDKVEQLEQEVKVQRANDIKAEPSSVETFDVKTCQSKLAEHYRRTATVPTSVWCRASLVDIHEIYTRLSWVKQEQTPSGTSKSELTHYSDLFSPNEKGAVPKRILVQGQTGIGKSTFVKKLAVDWAELEKTGDEHATSIRKDDESTSRKDDESSSTEDYGDRSKKLTDALRKFELVVAVNLKEVSKCQSLNDVISHSSIFADEDKPLTDDLLTYITNNQEKVLLVFDSYDEYQSGRNSEIYELFKGKKLRNCCVLITTRNSIADELREFKDVHAEITGFSLRDMNVFMKRILGSREQAKNLLDHLEEKNLKDLAKVPLLLLFFCTLWKNGQLESFPKTKTKLYTAIVQYVLDHNQEKNSSRRFGKVQDFKEFLVEIGKVALEGLLKDDHVFEYDELSAAIRCQESFIIGLLQVNEYAESLRPAGMVCFIHKSIQEFLAAWYITYSCIPEGNLGAVEEHARSLEQCQALESVFQFVCGLTDEGAVHVFEHLHSVRVSDPSLNLSTVPDVGVPLCDITERQLTFNDFVLDSFQEVQSKAELSKNCFDCVGGIILVGTMRSDLPFVNDLKSWSLHFCYDDRQSEGKESVSNLYKWLAFWNNESSELHKLRLSLERFLSVECTESCTFYSCLCFRNDQVNLYITGLWLTCSTHASLFTEVAVPSDSASFCSELFNLNFLGSLICYGSIGELLTKAFGTIFRNCKHLREVELSFNGDVLCDILKQVSDLDTYPLSIGDMVDSNLKSEEAVQLADLLPRFNNIFTLRLHTKDCSAAAVTTLVSSITHKNLKELLLSKISMTSEVAKALGQSLPKLSSLRRLFLFGINGGTNLQAADVETLFGGFNEPSPLALLNLSDFNMRGSLTPLVKRLCFFPNLGGLYLRYLNLDESDLCGLLESFSFNPDLSVLNLDGNPLGHAVTSIVPHITKLPNLEDLSLSETGCSKEDRSYVHGAVKQVLPRLSVR